MKNIFDYLNKYTWFKTLNKYRWWILAFSGPIIVNTVVRIPQIPFITVGDSEEWLGFFGNYLGAIVGGIVAYQIAKNQVEKFKEQEDRKEKLSIRPYLRITRLLQKTCGK